MCTARASSQGRCSAGYPWKFAHSIWDRTVLAVAYKYRELTALNSGLRLHWRSWSRTLEYGEYGNTLPRKWSACDFGTWRQEEIWSIVHSVSCTKQWGVASNTRGAAKKRYFSQREENGWYRHQGRQYCWSQNSSRHKTRSFSRISVSSTTVIIRERVANDASVSLPPVTTIKVQKCFDIQDAFGWESLQCPGPDN